MGYVIFVLCVDFYINLTGIASPMVDQVRSGRLRHVGISMGLASEADLEEMAIAWAEWQDRDDASIAMMHGEVIIQK